MDKEVQVFIDDNRMVRLFCEPADLFAVVTGLKLQGYTPKVRYFDDELNDWTCWQPTQHNSEKKVA